MSHPTTKGGAIYAAASTLHLDSIEFYSNAAKVFNRFADPPALESRICVPVLAIIQY